MSSCPNHSPPRLQVTTGFCGLKCMRLTPLSHEPQHILDATKQFTQRPGWLQKRSRLIFVNIYKKWRGKKTPKNLDKFKEFEKDLALAMRALDRFFFGGSLTMKRPSLHPHKPISAPISSLVAENYVFCNRSHHKGAAAHLTREGQPKDRGLTHIGEEGRTEIYIDTYVYGRHTTTRETFEVLFHEMTHAIYMSFSCRTSKCAHHAQDCQIFGRQGHGLLWKKMAEYVSDTIRTWDDSLVDFIDEDHI